MMDRAYAAEDAIERSRAVPSGIIRLACSTSLLDSRLAPMLARFMAECPVVELLVKSYNRRVDVIGEGFDCPERAPSATGEQRAGDAQVGR